MALDYKFALCGGSLWIWWPLAYVSGYTITLEESLAGGCTDSTVESSSSSRKKQRHQESHDTTVAEPGQEHQPPKFQSRALLTKSNNTSSLREIFFLDYLKYFGLALGITMEGRGKESSFDCGTLHRINISLRHRVVSTNLVLPAKVRSQTIWISDLSKPPTRDGCARIPC